MFDPDRLPVPKIPKISSLLNSSVPEVSFPSSFSALAQRPLRLCVIFSLRLFYSLFTTHYSLSLKLHHQIRLPDLLQRQLHSACRFPLQLQPHLPIHKSRQPSLKILLIFHRFGRRNLRHPPAKSLVLRRIPQRPIHPRGTHLQGVPRSPRNQLFHI